MTSPKPLLDRVQQVAQIIALLALPLIVAFGGWWMQSATARDATNQKYLELALNILREKPSEETAALHDWAANMVNRYSPVSLPEATLNSLRSGKTVFPKQSRSEVVWTVPDNPFLPGSGSDQKPQPFRDDSMANPPSPQH